MLPGFRLIAATFLCGFFVVFAGLRLAASLNDIHEGLPVMAAHAAPVSIAPAADHEMRRGMSAVPVMYDLRFAVAPVSPVLASVTPVYEPPAPPLVIVPPDAIAKEIPAAVAAIPAEAPLPAAPALPAAPDVAAVPLTPDTAAPEAP